MLNNVEQDQSSLNAEAKEFVSFQQLNQPRSYHQYQETPFRKCDNHKIHYKLIRHLT